jgi:hypothetical protein
LLDPDQDPHSICGSGFRTQSVSIQGERSESCDVDSVVPQRTVLGLIVFTVYIDELEVEAIQRLLEILIMFAKVIESAAERDKLQEVLPVDCLCD